MSDDSTVCIIIIYFGKLPEWFDMWRFMANKNENIQFHLLQDQIESKIEKNINYINTSLEEFNQNTFIKENELQCNSPYKLCDYRPLLAHIFPKLIEKYSYWGWGDIDVFYGDIYGTLELAIGKYDYISTGWNGESGPLALVRNNENINNLWTKIPEVKKLLNSTKSYAIDEIHFVEILRREVSCNIQFRECLHDLPAIWRNGHIIALRSAKEYTLFHFGGHVKNSQKQLNRSAKILFEYIENGGVILIGRNFQLKKIPKIIDNIMKYLNR